MSKTRKSSVCLVGQLEEYELGKSGKVRSLSLVTSDGPAQVRLTVKLTKASRLGLLRGTLEGLVAQGAWLEIIGKQKVGSDGTPKGLKAKGLKVLSGPTEAQKPVVKDLGSAVSRPPAALSKILICQKSSCRKRGSLAVQHALEQELGDRQLSDQVTVKATGCLKNCSKGPNLIINKTPHRNVKVKDLAKLLDQYFAPRPAVMV
jgi:Thioredoxin-like [2Fe-2S] ferredoxin